MPRVSNTNGATQQSEPTIAANTLAHNCLVAVCMGCSLHHVCVAWAIDNSFTRKVSIHDSMSIACAKGLVAGPIGVAPAIHYGAQLPSVVRIIQAGVVGFIGYGLSLTLFVVAPRNPVGF